ncbi:MAG: fibronectin type III domain-containing protein, partial [Bacteroidales bacterium]|nr:fibronectin type III domain-containing protein [Bacteroidales bacterium]
TILSTHTYPITRWNGTGTVTGLTNIAQTTQNSIAFDVVEDLGWHIPYVKECSVTASQHEVMLEWVANHVGPYNWRVEWRSMKSVEPQILYSDKNSIKLTNLTPGEDYTCSIYMQSGEWHSRPYNVSFSTMPELSQFPVIADMKGNFAVGDSVRLYILNLKSTPESQQWFVNNQPYNEETLTFSAPGTYLIKVEYSLDGSRVDILSKKVVVK